jgi:hypothetical protein
MQEGRTELNKRNLEARNAGMESTSSLEKRQGAANLE